MRKTNTKSINISIELPNMRDTNPLKVSATSLEVFIESSVEGRESHQTMRLPIEMGVELHRALGDIINNLGIDE
jgi:hypothetical protein